MGNGIYTAMNIVICPRQFLFSAKMSQQWNFTLMEKKCTIPLHFWNNALWFSAAITCIIKVVVETIKYNITKVKQQRTMGNRARDDRPCKFTVKNSIVLDESIWQKKQVNVKRTNRKNYLRIEIGIYSDEQRTVSPSQLGSKNTLPYKIAWIT